MGLEWQPKSKSQYVGSSSVGLVLLSVSLLSTLSSLLKAESWKSRSKSQSVRSSSLGLVLGDSSLPRLSSPLKAEAAEPRS